MITNLYIFLRVYYITSTESGIFWYAIVFSTQGNIAVITYYAQMWSGKPQVGGLHNTYCLNRVFQWFIKNTLITGVNVCS